MVQNYKKRPLSLKVEALAVATWDTTKNFVIESVRHPIQSRIDLSVGATKRVGHYLKEGMKFLVNTRDPNDRISIEMVETMDTVAANLDGLFTTWIQRHNPKHNPNSSSTRVGGVALDIALWETGLRLLKGGRVLTAAESIPLASERLGIQSQRAILETINRPVYRSGFVSEKAAMKLTERNVSKIRTDWVFPKKGGAMINGRWYTEHALERMAPRTPEVMAELEVRALNRAAAEGIKPQTKGFKDFWLKHKPDPRNIPPSVVEAEIANPGSTSIRVKLNNRGDIITVMPGEKR